MKIKHKYFKIPTEPIEVWPEKGIGELTEEMLMTGFQGRKLAEVVQVWTNMIRKKKIVIWLGLSGALVPAGMRKIISHLIKRRMIDVLVSTGANLYHDAVESLGVYHYVGTHNIDDAKLREHKVDRIYDVYGNEKKFYEIDNIIRDEFSQTLKDYYPYSSREVLYLLGKFLSKRAKDKNSILISAYKYKVPIFCPALGDSSIGFSMMFANRAQNNKRYRIRTINGKPVKIKVKKIVVDMMKDVHESSKITEKAITTGVIYLGGGTPKNYIQQTSVISGYQTRHDKSHSFAAQITTDLPEWGGLSGCTFEEAQSWGKIKPNAKMAICHCDSTIGLPIVVHALEDKFKRLRRNVPEFRFRNGTMKIDYKKMSL